MNAPFAYLQAEVMAASPPKLRLLLIEAALRLARQSLAAAESPQPDAAPRALRGLKKILRQLLVSLGREDDPTARNLRGVYMRLYCTVAEAALTADTQQINQVIKVLQVERETWRTLTERYVAGAQSLPPSLSASSEAAPALTFHCLA
ncbi:MAG: flagellar protein FliS [Planctomycetes bacterium]|nr:flagellar protein FliS [Planctomycetota bacterium]